MARTAQAMRSADPGLGGSEKGAQSAEGIDTSGAERELPRRGHDCSSR
jgi:hypothetical protein